MRKETTQKTYELNYLVNKYFHRQKKLALLCKNISLTVSRWENLHYIVQIMVFRDDRKISSALSDVNCCLHEYNAPRS